MKRADKILIAVFVVVMIMVMASMGKLYAIRSSIKDSGRGVPTGTDTSIVRLRRPVPGGGTILCSGTVVSDTHILTAAHCLAATEFDIFPPIIEIRTADDLPIGVAAQIQAFDPSTDLGVLSGDFRAFAKRNILSGAAEINLAFKTHRIMICGYPSGGRFTCSEMKNSRNFFFKFKSKGFAYPGMSGGPVIDLDTGSILGVTSAVEDDRVILSPFIEVLKDLHIENL